MTALTIIALVIACLAFAHSIRMKLWIERIERRNQPQEPELFI